MKHNTMKALSYGREVDSHTLEMKYEDFEALASFLSTVGVRIRITKTDCRTCTIEADNPYRTAAHWYGEQAVIDMGNEAMTEKEVERYRL